MSDQQLSPADLKAALARWAAANARPAWRPTVATGGDHAVHSRFGGPPLLVPSEPSPTCTQCDRTMQLMVQLDLAALPAREFGTGILQFFHCVGQRPNEAPDGKPDCYADGAWAAFSNEASHVRVLPAPGLVVGDAPTDPKWSTVSIIGWEHYLDTPDAEDHLAAGLQREYDYAAGTVTIDCPAEGLHTTIAIDAIEVEEMSAASAGDKLGGWPRWVQGAEYPSCPTCGTQMRLVTQVASNEHVKHMWGDGGIGHITQCPQHLDVVAFGWASG